MNNNTPNDDEREARGLSYQFCDQCAGPHTDEWLQQYGGHWDTCPNRAQVAPQVADSLALARFDTEELHQIRLRRGSDAELLDALNAYHLDEHELWGDAEPPTLDDYSTLDADRMRAALRAAWVRR